MNHADSTDRFCFSLWSRFANSVAISSKIHNFFPFSWRHFKRSRISVLLDSFLTVTSLGLACGGKL